MLFSITESEQEILQIVHRAAKSVGSPAYLVGGYVRDRLLARDCKDLDIVCVGDGIALAEEVAGYLRPIPRVTVYKRFGTAMLRHGDIELEFVGARKESYRSDSRKPAVEQGTLEDDQNRRDFTINALAVSLNDGNYGEIIDPFNGLLDLEEKRIKTPLDPGKTFTDDPLRMLRAIRFSNQLDFEIEPDTLHAISLYRNRIQIVSQERITIELTKILETYKPSQGFILLYKTGLLELVFPEISNLHGVEVVKGIGHKDNFYHTLKVLDNLAARSNNVWLRWAALLHDVAKPATKRFSPEAGWTFHGHEALGASMVPRIFRRLRLPLDHKMKYVQKLVRLHLRPISLTKEDITDSAMRRLLFEAGEDLDDLMLLCEADITSKNENKVNKYLQNYEQVREKLQEVEEKDQLRNWQPPITGQVIMKTFNLSPCRQVGDIKKAIREAILDGEIGNNYDDAYRYMLKKGRELGLSARSEDELTGTTPKSGNGET
ncbi:MAG: CCA tRNA nucleotidyltransferase [Saprospiraceae bacterium]|nr:CCA tRNA nucleotidyltransferase [Saprospiraceae bacterium]